MKKFTTMAICFVLIACMVAGGSLAYLTDRDSEANVFTVGDVKIELSEDFEQGAKLTPGVDIKKLPTIKNTGINDAWVWMELAIPTALDNPSDASQNAIHWNSLGATWEGYTNAERIQTAFNEGKLTQEMFPTDVTNCVDFILSQKATWTHSNSKRTAKIADGKELTASDAGYADAIEYNVYVIPYNKALTPGETTLPSIVNVYLDKHIDIDPEGNWYKVDAGVVTDLDWNTNEDGAPIIYVSAYGIQKEGFNSVEEAYAAYGEQWADKGYEWGNPNKWEAPEGATIIKLDGNDKSAVITAIDKAKSGDVIQLNEDTTIAGYAANEKLVIEKDITLDLNGKTLTTECDWGGIDLKGGASIVNGTINHTGNTAAIKAFQVGTIENVTINVTETDGKTKGGIVVQEGDGCYVGSIKNVTINGATNGIECYRSTNDNAIGSMKNVTINATENGIYLNGAGKIGKIENCDIKGGNIGINAYLANLWHISLDIVNSTVEGGTSGIDIWDEAKDNTGSTVTFNYDNASKFIGSTNNIKVTLQDEITCTINGVEK